MGKYIEAERELTISAKTDVLIVGGGIAGVAAAMAAARNGAKVTLVEREYGLGGLATLGLIALARPVTMVLFPQWESLGLASALLALLGVTVIFYSIATIMNAALQSIGRMQMPLVSAGIALAVQTLVLLVLLFATNMGVFALVLVSVLYSLMIFLLDTYFLQRYLKLDMDLYNVYARPLFAATIMGVATYGLYTMFEVFLELVGSRSLYLNNLIAMVPAILAAVLIYFFALIRMGTLSEEDILSLPKGGMLLKIFRKLKWMKG